jgi:uncharacterized protein with von Willebrand factor type A (vWA) domain
VSRATRFPARAAGPAERVAGFVAHLRANGWAAGQAETARALAALAAVRAGDPAEARLALRAALAASAEDWRRFEGLYDAYWFDAGRRRAGVAPAPRAASPAIWAEARAAGAEAGGTAGAASGSDDAGGPAEAGVEGRLSAATRAAIDRRDLHALTDPAELREAERVAERLARAIRVRGARRRAPAPRGREIDLGRTLRRALARGGEPMDLARRRRRTPPMRVAALLDVSGSMEAHARVFLAFLRGLVGTGLDAEAFLFHTRLVRITGALADRDAPRAAERLALLAEGFGGGTRIGGALAAFNAVYAKACVNGRTAVVILSDGCDGEPPTRLGAELARLRRRAGRVVWLNPLRSWRDYAPVAAGMAAALPHLDAFLPAATLADLAALEAEFRRL